MYIWICTYGKDTVLFYIYQIVTQSRSGMSLIIHFVTPDEFSLAVLKNSQQ